MIGRKERGFLRSVRIEDPDPGVSVESGVVMINVP